MNALMSWYECSACVGMNAWYECSACVGMNALPVLV